MKDILGDKLSQQTLDRIIDEADIIGDHKIWKDEFMALARESFNDTSDEENYQHQDDTSHKTMRASCFEFDYENRIQERADLKRLPQCNINSLLQDIDLGDLGASQFGIEKEKSLRKAKLSV